MRRRAGLRVREHLLVHAHALGEVDEVPGFSTLAPLFVCGYAPVDDPYYGGTVDRRGPEQPELFLAAPIVGAAIAGVVYRVVAAEK